METLPEKTDPKKPADFNSVGGCCLSLVLVLLTGILAWLTTTILAAVWLRYAYANVEFYHSSVSRGGFHIAFDAFVLSVIPSAVCSILFFIRSGTYSFISWKRAKAFFIRSFVLIWLIATIITFLLTVFYELPSWGVIKGW